MLPTSPPEGSGPFNSLPSADGRPSADTAARRWRRLYALGGRGYWPPSAAGECRPHGGGKRGKTTKVFFPLLTPQTFLRTRLPAVARLKARGPQGRLVLQGSTLDGSGVFRSDGVCALHRMAAHCYARRATQGKFRAVKYPITCPTHGTEPP